MSAIAPEAFELAKVVVIGRLTGCCGPLANEVAARRTGKKLRSFMVFTSFQNVLRHGTKKKNRRPRHLPYTPYGFFFAPGLATNPRRWSVVSQVPAIWPAALMPQAVVLTAPGQSSLVKVAPSARNP